MNTLIEQHSMDTRLSKIARNGTPRGWRHTRQTAKKMERQVGVNFMRAMDLITQEKQAKCLTKAEKVKF